MKKLCSLGIIVLGFVLALIAFSDNAIAGPEDSFTSNNVSAGGCVGSGYCGRTANGTSLAGKWQE